MIARLLRARVFVSTPAVILLALSAFLATMGLFAAQLYAQDQISEFRAQASDNDQEAVCRSRITGYVEGLSIAQDIALGTGLLDRLGPNNDETFRQAVDAYDEAVRKLEAARDYREQAVEVCARDPLFDPTNDIPQTEETP